MPEPARMRLHRADLWVLGVIAALGVLVCVQPFTGDQALFAAGARQLRHGGVLYRDFWDVKQPGIYAFYLVGGALFGFSEIAIHLFELAVLLVFAAVLQVSLRDRFDRPWVAALVPLFVVGTYYAAAAPLGLTQVESLIGFPLFLSLWFAVKAGDAPERERVWLFLSGLAGGLVLVLKLVFAPILAAFWLIAMVHLWRSAPDGRVRRAVMAGVAVAAGVLVPVGMVVVYLAAYGQLETVRWTYFTVTPKTTSVAGRPVSRLTHGAVTTAARWAVPLVLAVVGVVATLRRGWKRFELGLAAWIVVGIPVFLLQHWWIYQYSMFLVPVGIFAAHGVDALAQILASRGVVARRRAVIAVVAVGGLLAVPAAITVVRDGRDVISHGGALTVEDRFELRAAGEPLYRPARAWARYLRRPGTPRGGVYVLANPLDLYLSDRTQTVAINGWSPEQYPSIVWDRLTGQLEQAHPPEIVVDRFSNRIMRAAAPNTRRLIRSRYCRVGGHGPDSWYRLRATGGC